MATSKPFLLVSTIRQLWQSHAKNNGRVYGGTSRDLREAKEWLGVNEWEPGEIEEVEKRFNRFMESDFEGWKETDYPIWAFLKHYGRYAEPRQVREAPRRSTFTCPKCEMQHRVSEPCPTRNISQLIGTITKAI
jgi:hypothetical protein